MHFQSVSPSYLILRSMLGLGFWHFFFAHKKRRGEKFAQKIYQTLDDSFCVYDDENLYLFFFFFFLPDEKREKKRKISEWIVFLVQFKFFFFVFFFF